jgi:hypothetical protein
LVVAVPQFGVPFGMLSTYVLRPRFVRTMKAAHTGHPNSATISAAAPVTWSVRVLVAKFNMFAMNRRSVPTLCGCTLRVPEVVRPWATRYASMSRRASAVAVECEVTFGMLLMTVDLGAPPTMLTSICCKLADPWVRRLRNVWWMSFGVRGSLMAR